MNNKNIIEEKLEFLYESRRDEMMRYELDELPGTHKINLINNEISALEAELLKVEMNEHFNNIEKTHS